MLTDEIIEAVNAAGLALMRERSRLPDAESGLGDYYASRLRGGRAIHDYETAVARAAIDYAGDLPIIEVGGGLGFMAAALALAGHRVYSIERDGARLSAQQALLEALRALDRSIDERLTLAAHAFPDVAASIPRDALLVFTNTICTTTLEERRRIVQGIGSYRATIFDAARFFGDNATPALLTACLRLFVEAGLEPEFVAGLSSCAGPYFSVAGDPQAHRHDIAVAPAPPAVNVVFARPFLHDARYSWRLSLPAEFAPHGDTQEEQARSPALLHEDGRLLGPAHQPHADIARLGAGRYSHWRTGIYFSASDNSDPNTNGRTYRLSIPDVAQGAAEPAADERVAPAAPSDQGADGPHEQAIDRTPILIDAGAVDALAQIIARRGVDRIVYFHADHFEPWGAPTQAATFAALERFAGQTSRSRFASRLSLFYKPAINAELAEGHHPEGYRALDDNVVFQPLGQAYAPAIQAIAAGGHDFHLHIHHEGWTRNDSRFDRPVARWVNENSNAELDAARMDLFTQLALSRVRAESGQPLETWGFVHGNWALNASDPMICKIENEIGLLMKHGCFGDFSFPAGRSYCDPESTTTPYTCLPVTGPKSFDTPEAQPIALGADGAAFASGRFFIWASAIKAETSSLDYWSNARLAFFRQPEVLIRSWLEKSVVLDQTLFIKTHAHSIDGAYRLWEQDAVVPHAQRDVVRVFDLLERVADQAKAPIEPLTVSEVMTRLRTFEHRLATG